MSDERDEMRADIAALKAQNAALREEIKLYSDENLRLIGCWETERAERDEARAAAAEAQARVTVVHQHMESMRRQRHAARAEVARLREALTALADAWDASDDVDEVLVMDTLERVIQPYRAKAEHRAEHQ